VVAAAAETDVAPTHVLIATLENFWWLWTLIALIGAAKLAWRFYKWRRLVRSGIADVDQMDGRTFEEFLVTLFRRLGYAVEHTGRRGDYGADLVIAKQGKRTVVQAKRSARSVGVKAVQEVATAKAPYRCTGALVVTNSRFSRQARTLASANNVVLWDRDALIDRLLAASN
jgi:restriction system protein